MEGAGVYAAAVRDRTEWIVVKGICDWGREKTYDFQELAAGNAAEFVLGLIERGRSRTGDHGVGIPTIEHCGHLNSRHQYLYEKRASDHTLPPLSGW